MKAQALAMLTALLLSGCFGANPSSPPPLSTQFYGPGAVDSGNYWLFSHSAHEFDIVTLKAPWDGKDNGYVFLQGLSNETSLLDGINAHYFQENTLIGSILYERQDQRSPFTEIGRSSLQGQCELQSFPSQFVTTVDPCVTIIQRSLIDESSKHVNFLGVTATLTDSYTKDSKFHHDMIFHDGERTRYFEKEFQLSSEECWIQQADLPTGIMTQIGSSCNEGSRMDSHTGLKELQEFPVDPNPVFFNEQFRVGCFIDTFHLGASNVQTNPFEFSCAERISNTPRTELGFKYMGNVYENGSPSLSTPLPIRLTFTNGSFIQGVPENMEFSVSSLDDLERMSLEVDGFDVFSRYYVLLSVDYPSSIDFKWRFRESSQELVDRSHLV